MIIITWGAGESLPIKIDHYIFEYFHRNLELGDEIIVSQKFRAFRNKRLLLHQNND